LDGVTSALTAFSPGCVLLLASLVGNDSLQALPYSFANMDSKAHRKTTITVIIVATRLCRKTCRKATSSFRLRIRTKAMTIFATATQVLIRLGKHFFHTWLLSTNIFRYLSHFPRGSIGLRSTACPYGGKIGHGDYRPVARYICCSICFGIDFNELGCGKMNQTRFTVQLHRNGRVGDMLNLAWARIQLRRKWRP